MKRNKVLDLRTERGLKIYKNMCECYNSLYYGIDKALIYSEGYTHVIKSDNSIVNCK